MTPTGCRAAAARLARRGARAAGRWPRARGAHPLLGALHRRLRPVPRAAGLRRGVGARAAADAAALELNPASCSVWHHRRHLLEALGCPLQPELDFTRRVIEDHPKNYQVWHHRRLLVERRGQSADELRLTEIVLAQDPKNFHAWQYRRWAVRRLDLY